MAWIDAPHLSQLRITFFMDPIFDVPHLHRFVSCVEELKGLREAIATFCQGEVVPAALMCERQAEDGDGLFMLQIRNRESDRQRLLSSMAQLCHSSMAPFSSSEWLKIYDTCIQISNEPHWNQDMERTQWLAFLEPFIAVKDLHLSELVAPQIGRALEYLTAQRVTKVLPALRNFYIRSSEPVRELFEQFVTLRELSGQPVAIHYVRGGMRNLVDD